MLVCLLGFLVGKSLVKVWNPISNGIVFVYHLAWCVRGLQSLKLFWPYLIASRSCLLKAFRHFLTTNRKKTFQRIFSYNSGCKRSFKRFSCLEFIFEKSTHREAGLIHKLLSLCFKPVLSLKAWRLKTQEKSLFDWKYKFMNRSFAFSPG